MDTHNNCWAAWAAMGKDHICQPLLYVEKFLKRETRMKLTSLTEKFKENDEKAISVLSKLCSGYNVI